ncbi:hypothetical protein MSG28_006900, partial [Choristoneura fumiferana]
SIAGVFTADNARRRLANLSGSTSEDLEKFIVKKFYKVDLAENPTLGLKAVGVITSSDLLGHISKAQYKNGTQN